MISIKVNESQASKNFARKGLQYHGLKILKQLEGDLKDELQIIADGAVMAMRNFITVKSKNSDGVLEEALTVEFTQGRNTISFGIGNKEKLTREVPYWYVLNFGTTFSGQKFIPRGFIGYVNGGAPIAGEVNKTGDVFEQNGGGHLIKPGSFTPIDYISVGMNYISSRLRELEKAISRK